MGDAPADKRIDFLRDRIVQLLKCKPELFDALLKTEEGELIKRFLNDGGCTRIFFSAGPKDMFVTEKLPDDKQTKKKAIFAMKLAEDVKFDEKKMDEMLNSELSEEEEASKRLDALIEQEEKDEE